MEQSLTTTQEQLSQRVAEVVKLEQNIRKLNTELKTMKERNASNEEEIGEQKAMIEKLRRDLLAAKEETHLAIQEGMTYKQKSSKLEVELDGSREQERMLGEQVCLQLVRLISLNVSLSVNSKCACVSTILVVHGI